MKPANWKKYNSDGCAARWGPDRLLAAKRHRYSARTTRSRGLLRRFALRDDTLQPADIFQKPLAGQNQKVIAELRVLEVDLQQLFVGDGQHVRVCGALHGGR